MSEAIELINVAEAKQQKAKQKAKDNYQKNRDEYLAKSKERYKAKRESIIARQITYNQKNKEKCKEYSKRYYENNKETISEKYRERFGHKKREPIDKSDRMCEDCNQMIRYNNLKHHEMSNKHQNNKMKRLVENCSNVIEQPEDTVAKIEDIVEEEPKPNPKPLAKPVSTTVRRLRRAGV